jgi:hypothetical protein
MPTRPSVARPATVEKSPNAHSLGRTAVHAPRYQPFSSPVTTRTSPCLNESSSLFCAAKSYSACDRAQCVRRRGCTRPRPQGYLAAPVERRGLVALRGRSARSRAVDRHVAGGEDTATPAQLASPPALIRLGDDLRTQVRSGGHVVRVRAREERARGMRALITSPCLKGRSSGWSDSKSKRPVAYSAPPAAAAPAGRDAVAAPPVDLMLPEVEAEGPAGDAAAGAATRAADCEPGTDTA